MLSNQPTLWNRFCAALGHLETRCQRAKPEEQNAFALQILDDRILVADYKALRTPLAACPLLPHFTPTSKFEYGDPNEATDH